MARVLLVAALLLMPALASAQGQPQSVGWNGEIGRDWFFSKPVALILGALQFIVIAGAVIVSIVPSRRYEDDPRNPPAR